MTVLFTFAEHFSCFDRLYYPANPFYTFAVAAVNFANQVYDVAEGNSLVQLILTLSNPSSYNFTIRVLTTDGSATGKLLYYCRWLCV